MHYELLDSGEGKKLEQLGRYRLVRPCLQALWRPSLLKEEWKRADAFFSREKENTWIGREKLPEEWEVELDGLRLRVSLTDFGHVGLFPEHSRFWPAMQDLLKKTGKKRGAPPSVLNLFAYSGGATLACAAAGAAVCHVDASKGMVSWARENAERNGMAEAPIRWIVDEAGKFIRRELRRGRKYDAILLDPPSFGRGPKGEVFKIEEQLLPILEECRELLSDQPLFFLLTSHTPGYTPLVLHHVMQPLFSGGTLEQGEMTIPSKTGISLPSGSFGFWRADG